ncbi:MAG: putative baseplate assembly protein [Candidatus Promineifilaceae bacterium]
MSLEACGCCWAEGEQQAIYNPAGLSRLRYRIGVHSSFLRQMLNRLGSEELPDGDHAGERPLRDLTARTPDDLAIALLDAWAAVGDVLTFYQERIANEGFLPTATERRSVLEMARAIGYELRPGVAAETFLAFTVDETGGAPAEAPIPAGTQAQSVPQAQGELPQTFETAEAITARAAWNALRLVLSLAQTLSSASQTIYLAGTATNLKAGDMLLLVKSDNSASRLRRVQAVASDSARGLTAVTLAEAAGMSGAFAAYALRERASIFGHNAPNYLSLPDELTGDDDAFPHPWDSATAGAIFSIWHDSTLRNPADLDDRFFYNYGDFFLDRAMGGLNAGDFVAIHQSGLGSRSFKIREVTEISVAGFAISGNATGLFLNHLDGSQVISADKDSPSLSGFKVRNTAVYSRSEALPLAQTPWLGDVAAGKWLLSLQGLGLSLSAGQALAVSGLTPAGEPASEVRRVMAAFEAAGTTIVVFDAGLEHSYRRDSLALNANAVRASHGESVRGEVLGGGDGAQANQRFVLKKTPLTHLSAANASGAEAALEVEVDGVEWQRVDTLYAQPAGARIYTLRLDDEARASLIFGDGKSGARLPTGLENVAATYRSGIGLAGEVGAGTLTLLKTRPFGVSGVTNPLPAEGGEEPEKLNDARSNVPMTVLTLDRVVSLRDFEDFARAFAGVGKALAAAVWTGEQEVAHLTLADSQGESLAEDSSVFINLKAAVNGARDLLRELRLASYEGLTFDLSARLLLDAAYDWEDVQAAATASLEAAFAFEARAFGQPVTAAEIVALLHGLEGVIAVDVEALHLTGEPAEVSAALAAQTARYDPASQTILPAQLLRLNPAGLSLAKMALSWNDHMSWAHGQRLYDLLPAHLRRRDAGQGEPLRALLSVIERQFETLETDIEGLYENWFIETCAEWVVPYLGDLLGVRRLQATGAAGLYSLRAYVANTLAYRQRKGTATVLEQLARDVTNWPAHAVEFFQLLATTQHLNHVRLYNQRTPDLRASNRLELLNGPFDTSAHTAEVRHIGRRAGRYNIPNVGIYLWRLGAYFLAQTTPRPAAAPADGRYRFNALGLDAPLFNRPQTEASITHLATEINVPAPLRRRAAFERPGDYLGAQPSFEVYFDGPSPLQPEEIVICNLEGWDDPAWAAPASDGTTRVAVDPALGRWAVLSGTAAPTDPLVSQGYGFSGDVGGGPYNRRESLAASLDRPLTWQLEVNQSAAPIPGQRVNSLAAAVAEWNAQPAGAAGLIAISDSRTYAENLTGNDAITLAAGSQLHLVAARPVGAVPAASVDDLEASELRPHLLGNLSVRGSAPAADPNQGELVVNGLLLEGVLRVLVGNLGRLSLAHCTLPPAAERLIVNPSLNPDEQNDRLELNLERTICGGVNLPPGVPLLKIRDCILDNAAAADIEAPGAEVTIERSTVVGADDPAPAVRVLWASECIFTGRLMVERRQIGCVRFSHVPAGSRTSRRYRCQPDLAAEGLTAPAELQAVRARLRPLFTSASFGQPGYRQLAQHCALEIRTGAEDGSEMGVWSHLKQPQREANLRTALAEYLRFGLDTGIFRVT